MPYWTYNDEKSHFGIKQLNDSFHSTRCRNKNGQNTSKQFLYLFRLHHTDCIHWQLEPMQQQGGEGMGTGEGWGGG